jgi:hypothetical protein
VSYTVVNVEETIGKTVGRRRVRDSWKTGMALQRESIGLRKAFGYGGICPRGVFRFRSHEEADEWMMKMLVERATRRKS